jgi:hypothetical protein
MLNAADWTTRLNELATEANVPGAALGIWAGDREILAAHGVLNSATRVPVTTDSAVGQPARTPGGPTWSGTPATTSACPGSSTCRSATGGCGWR